MERPKRTSRWRIALRVALAGVAAVLLGVFVRWLGGNQGTVSPGSIHRSGQLTGAGLSRAIRSKGLRTVLNLRGGNPSERWYQEERGASLAQGATLVDFAMASDMDLSRYQARALVDLLDRCEKPMLIHCQWGAERTGLASAFAELLRPGGSLESARGQFTPYYLYLPIRDGLTMRRHIDRYEAWLAGQGIGHSSSAFRRWIRDGYDPGSPSREDWPYDPYPLVVLHRTAKPPPWELPRKPHPRAAASR
jgi:protein tyrosine phosphatase (PTP) superfamily phosphohydrolase (DUF442 family)